MSFDLSTTPSDFTSNLPNLPDNNLIEPNGEYVPTQLDQVGVGDAIREVEGRQKRKGLIHQIRDQLYYIEIWLYNQIENQEPFQVSFLFVHSLAIEESLNDWWVKGWITFNNTFEMFERGNTTGARTNVKAPYTFRSDGRNRLSLRLYPIPRNDDNFLASFGSSNVLPRDKWEMSFDCVIYDIEDIPSDNNIFKLKKCYFWDERYQIFSERNIEWSTGVQGIKTMEKSGLMSDTGKQAFELTDVERSIPANIAIKSIIDSASLIDPSIQNESGNVLKIGYTETGSIDKPNIPLNVFNLFWNNGPPVSEMQNLVLYNSPANATILDDIEYVMQNAMSENKNPVFLRYSRNVVQFENERTFNFSSQTIENKPLQQGKQWNLISLEEIFKNASQNQIERLFIEDGAESIKTPHIPRGPTEYSGDIINFTSGIASRIKSYKFSPMVSIDDLSLHNRPVHSYDFKTGTWNIFCEENTIKSAIDSFTDVAKKGLYSFEQNSDAHLTINLNQTKQKGIIHSNEHITRTFFPTNYSKLEMMKKLLFLNQTVNFTINGLTIRTPGQFIFIDSASSGPNNPFDDRFLGQWLILKVVHLFTKDSYITEVLATKVDTFSKIWNIEEDKL
jgi:hypothetical protein